MNRIVIVNQPNYDVIKVYDENDREIFKGERVRFNDDIVRDGVIERLKRVYKIKSNE